MTLFSELKRRTKRVLEQIDFFFQEHRTQINLGKNLFAISIYLAIIIQVFQGWSSGNMGSILFIPLATSNFHGIGQWILFGMGMLGSYLTIQSLQRTPKLFIDAVWGMGTYRRWKRRGKTVTTEYHTESNTKYDDIQRIARGSSLSHCKVVKDQNDLATIYLPLQIGEYASEA